ncbi:hypothetical protein HPP92_013470 [Vanilla planifolia]|uniref:Uncharacterized protein n=1 Tax=Vanilla planifolia TaxID=51239 RepID=A0A835V0N0_VANPL|nr:hypothetical protein HPP92_013470 [Vanilla planifolia]
MHVAHGASMLLSFPQSCYNFRNFCCASHLSYCVVWNILLAMRLMQIAYGFGMSTRLVYSAYVFLLVHEEEYQSMTSLTTTISLLSFLLASELGKMCILLSKLCVCCVVYLVPVIFRILRLKIPKM